VNCWKTLKLDQNYQPLEVITWADAITLLFLGKAEIVELYDGARVRSVSEEFNVPSVVRLVTRKFSKKRRGVKFSKVNVFFRDSFRCLYCGKKPGTSELTLDHVIPRCRRTPESYRRWENIVTACRPCNQHKAGRTPRQANMRLLKEPFKPKWEPRMAVRVKTSDPDIWQSYIYWKADPV